jgi:hypothetical protein
MAMAASTPSMRGADFAAEWAGSKVAVAAAKQAAQVARNGVGGTRRSNLHTGGSSGKSAAREIA